ncbi:MAG: HelD family protein [Allosphingosinicella sp.]|uniref:HelD family protein n=1 Tax=Allosphingosinicella sp. TaxID=2823234 RepID=UPI0039364E43
MTSIDPKELTRLEDCQRSIGRNLQLIGSRLDDYAKEVQESHEHMWEARRDMDHIDKIAMRQSIDQKMRSAEILRAQQQKLLKLRKSPYFGRFDFAREQAVKSGAVPIYVGVHDFRDEETGTTIVHDWRAPVSSIFYDHEIGLASYEAPSGEIRGNVELKRQFRIRDGVMQFMIESGVNIVDDVLQEELSRSSDEGMKTIVATIQRDQNAIIRDAEAHTLIIQGVAGSGKTSIALHRIAFLLYRFKDSLSSSDILILSPNRVFADYIGNVLPELGEEQVGEIGAETLADELLEGKFRFQTFFEQTSLLLEGNDEALKERISLKAAPEFLETIDRYVDHLEAGSFEAADWRSGRTIVPDWHFEETWRRYRELPLKERIAEVISMTEHKIFMHYKRELRPDERRSLRDAVRAMVRRATLRTAYKGMFEWMERPALFKPAGTKLEYSDVFPLIYLKMRLVGVDNPRAEVKHLLIDEMQDYTAVQYAVLGKLFPCRKTILGDAAQSVNPYSGSDAEQIRKILRAASPVKLTKSYRSSWEIMQFALGISPNAELEPIARHGEAPRVLACRTEKEAVTRILEEVEDFAASDHRSLAIITKTSKQAAKLHRRLAASGIEPRLLDADSTGYSTGAIVCTAHLAKGLEFDRVLVADASAGNYRTELDRNLLYVACTRAMHRLTLLATGDPSPLLPSLPTG